MNYALSLVNTFAASWADALIRACWQGGLEIALVWLVCRLWPAMPPNPRCWLWRLAYAKLLLGLVWLPPLTLPLLPTAPLSARIAALSGPASRTALADAPSAASATASDLSHAALPAPPDPIPVQPPSSRPTPPTVQTCLLAAWLLGVLVSLGQVAAAWHRAYLLYHASTPLADEALRADAAELCRRFGLGRIPPMCVADGLASPLLLGLTRPAVLLPGFVLSGSPRPELRLMLAHELAHLARRDLLWNGLPLLAQRLFFFHPLVWLVGLEWSLAQEIACDALAVEVTGAPPSAYGRMLLGIATRRRASAASLFPTLAVAAPRHTLRRRLFAMQHIGTASRPRVILAAALTFALAVGGLFPWRVVAQTGKPLSAPPAATPKEEAWQEKEKADFAPRNAQLDAQLAEILKPLSPERQKKAQADIAFMTAEDAKVQQHIQMLEQHRADYLSAHSNHLSDAQTADITKMLNLNIKRNDINAGVAWRSVLKAKLLAHLAAAHDAPSKQGYHTQIKTIDRQRLAAEREMRGLEPLIAAQKAKVALIPEDQRILMTKLRSYDVGISCDRTVAIMDKQMRIMVLRRQLAGKIPVRQQSRKTTIRASHVQLIRGAAVAAPSNHPTSAPVRVSPTMADALDKQIARLEKQQSTLLERQQRISNLIAPRTGVAEEGTGEAGEWAAIAFLKARRAGAAWAQASIASPEISPGLKGQKLANLRRSEQQAQQDKYIAEKYVFLLATRVMMREVRRTPLISFFSPHGPLRVRIFAQNTTGRHLILDKFAHGKNLIIPSVPMKEESKLNFLVYDNGKQVKEWWL